MKSAVIIEMAPLIHAKCSQKAGMTCFSDLAIVLYYEIMRLGFDYNRIDIVFDCYFDDNLKKGTRKSQGTGTILMFNDDTDIPRDMINNFLRNSQNKNNLNELLSKKKSTYIWTLSICCNIQRYMMFYINRNTRFTWYLNHTLSVRRSWPVTDSAYFALHISSVQKDCW